MKVKSGGNRDALVVVTSELEAVLSVWLAKHNAVYPNEDGQRNNHFTSGYSYILHKQPMLSNRALYRVVSGETKFTIFRIADAILTAIDEVTALHDGRIEVMPNPGWSNETWMAWKAEQGCI